jgi:signal transduction histidine kinase
MEAAAERLSHEHRIVSRLAGIEDLARLPQGDGSAAGTCPHAGRTLAQALADGPLETSSLLDIASRVAETLGAMHRCGVLHLNINPQNILLADDAPPLLLIDFQLAKTFAEERPGFVHHRRIRGNFTYLAPEQTGRTGRRVDSRSDLYALGATLYEAATGRPPFKPGDPLRLLHDHLARVPAKPVKVRPGLPVGLSQIIERLLEKEPERRYQSAEGLAHDLAQARIALARGDAGPIRLAERDFPTQLAAPARLVGRAAEIGALQQALDAVASGLARVVLVAGAPGVGKTSLINELRPMVTARRGWFVCGKFDQYRRDAPTATAEAFRALGRLLLAEPEAELSSHRERIVRALGANSSLMCALPEFEMLLGPRPEVPEAEPGRADARLGAAAANLLRVIASPERPLVFVIDDLQWASAQSIAFIDTVLNTPDLPGLLLVCSYRDSDIDAAHPLADALARWSEGAKPPLRLALDNLPADALEELLREMMRLPSPQAQALAAAIGPHTGGNPYDTIEVLNALRANGALRLGADGWHWDSDAVRRYVGPRSVVEMLSARIESIPSDSRRLLHLIACLGGRARGTLLGVAAGLSPGELEALLAPALEEGLLMIERGDEDELRMRHDRVQQAVHGSLAPARRRALHLELARRLSDTPEFARDAAQQYVHAVDEVHAPDECRRAARLLHTTALQTRSGANHAATQRMSAAALALLARVPAPHDARDAASRFALEIEQHWALCGLGRVDEADALYAVIECRGAPVEEWVTAACTQVRSLHDRGQSGDAVALGLPLLRRLGLAVPEDFAAADLAPMFARVLVWIGDIEVGHERRPFTGDRAATAAARLLRQLAYAEFFHGDRKVHAWLMLQSTELWILHGPSPELAQFLGGVALYVIGMGADYAGAHRIATHMVLVAQARGWERAASEARFLLAHLANHWFMPLEQNLRLLRMAREALLQDGELQTACFSERALVTALLDCAPTLGEFEDELESCLALASRIRCDDVVAMSLAEGKFVLQLRGAVGAAEPFPSDAALACSGGAFQMEALCNAVLAAIFGDLPALTHHAAAAMALFSPRHAGYRVTICFVLRALASARRAATADAAECRTLLAQLDHDREWLANRALAAPDNFLHLSKWIDAESAWVRNDFRAAVECFDAALQAASAVTRPWHHALIAERAGMFYVSCGISGNGRLLLTQARDLYGAWGATAKVRRMEIAHRFLAPQTPRAQAPEAMPVDSIDMLAILRASQTLSSETGVARLEALVVDLVRALTGATAVWLAIRDDDADDWCLSNPQAGPAAAPIAVEAAAASGLLPLAPFQYVERTRSPLVLADAVTDDRFTRDPYFAGLAQCSMLVVPIMKQGVLRGMLLMENRVSRNAFSGNGLDAISLIAGQLAVSLENARLYEKLERRVQEQTRELRDTQAQLVETARRAGMAQVATNVLHNVGNVLTSVNVSTHMLAEHVERSRTSRITDIAALLEEHAGLLEADETARLLPGYVRELAKALQDERALLVEELGRLGASVDHIKNVVAMQQSHAGAGQMFESCALADLADEALRLQGETLARYGVTVARDYAALAPARLDRIRSIQILVNLIENACHAMDGVPGPRVLTVAVDLDGSCQRVTVKDNGCGIEASHLPRLFAHGFTTKPGGHGFGLHSCALAAMEIGATLTAQSEGAGAGAIFVLRMPVSLA